MKKPSRHALFGIISCLLLIASGFMHWAWYPDIQKFFTGWQTEQNYYGKPAKYQLIFSLLGIACLLIGRVWSHRINLFVAALNMAFAIRNVILFTLSYDGYVPRAEFGLYLMVGASIGFMVFSALVFGTVKKPVPVQPE